MGGSSTVDSVGYQPGVYGTLGKPAAGNVPGARSDAATWTGNWLFGGYGWDANGHEGYLNDLWKFNPSTDEWTWIGGSSTLGAKSGQPGVYGTPGKPAAGNIPGGRSDASNWTDSSGNLWLFGGVGFDGNGDFGYLNDLWKFDPSTNEWAWMGGSSAIGELGSYEASGVPAAGNVPGAREDTASWTDVSGNLWLFGGWGFDGEGNRGDLNDLWEFKLSASGWAWMGGSSTLVCNGNGCSQPGVYGTLRKAAADNIPPGRLSVPSFADGSGHLWLFGGYSQDNNGTYTYFNDLWEFNPATNEWAWMGGSSTPGQPGVYGVLGIAAAGNIPGGRKNAVSWKGNSDFWLFGGQGYDVNGHLGELNDLWEFDLSTNQWTWIDGTSTGGNGTQPGVYGTLGKPAAGNIPGGRLDSTSWTDGSGNLWLIGGWGYDAKGDWGMLNDIWEYQPPAPALTAAATPTFNLTAGTYTSAQSVSISDATKGAAIYYTLDGSAPTGKSTPYKTALSIQKTTTVKAIAEASGYSNSAVATAVYTISPPASAPTFTPATGLYGEAQSATLASTTPGASIYYTTDGTTPSANSTKYIGPVAIGATETVKAFAAAKGYSNSAVASAAYTLVGSPQVLTGLASGIATPKATLNTTVNDFGAACEVLFVWGTSRTALNSTTPRTALPASAGAQKVSAALTGLNSKTTYYFRPVASTTGGTSYGAMQSFTTN